VVEDASTAPLKKPHPQVYLQTLKRLELPARACVALEDSANGLQAALAASLATIITPNAFTAHHDFKGALRVLPSLRDVNVAHLRAWHAEANAGKAFAARLIPSGELHDPTYRAHRPLHSVRGLRPAWARKSAPSRRRAPRSCTST
jgi:hypothetical protein